MSCTSCDDEVVPLLCAARSPASSRQRRRVKLAFFLGVRAAAHGAPALVLPEGECLSLLPRVSAHSGTAHLGGEFEAGECLSLPPRVSASGTAHRDADAILGIADSLPLSSDALGTAGWTPLSSYAAGVIVESTPQSSTTCLGTAVSTPLSSQAALGTVSADMGMGEFMVLSAALHKDVVTSFDRLMAFSGKLVASDSEVFVVEGAQSNGNEGGVMKLSELEKVAREAGTWLTVAETQSRLIEHMWKRLADKGYLIVQEGRAIHADCVNAGGQCTDGN
mmetsp:Transcript_109727/g.321188  ORF Transcript_109727/g.321188 Transcript_109727/m.321188 type:complete len:278 (-) Transcript_109727:296-1129(-)